MTDPRPTQQLAADVRDAFRDPDPNDHHRLCALRDGQDCDCYALRSADAHLALDALVARITDLEAQARETEERLEGDLWLATQGIDRWKDRALAAEAQVAALTQERDQLAQEYIIAASAQRAAEVLLATTRQAHEELRSKVLHIAQGWGGEPGDLLRRALAEKGEID